MSPPTDTLPAATPPTPTAAMIRTLGLIAALCGVIIVTAYQGTYQAVQENKRLAVERAVFKVIPRAKAIVEYAALANGALVKVGAGGTALTPGALRFYAGYDAAGELAGIAAEGA
ncbi:MAG: FMN-binding protein, partial [Anaerolineae bacterium]|nr:FMN-binding protein [Anaerolineae bacterium]